MSKISKEQAKKRPHNSCVAKKLEITAGGAHGTGEVLLLHLDRLKYSKLASIDPLSPKIYTPSLCIHICLSALSVLYLVSSSFSHIWRVHGITWISLVYIFWSMTKALNSKILLNATISICCRPTPIVILPTLTSLPLFVSIVSVALMFYSFTVLTMLTMKM